MIWKRIVSLMIIHQVSYDAQVQKIPMIYKKKKKKTLTKRIATPQEIKTERYTYCRIKTTKQLK